MRNKILIVLAVIVVLFVIVVASRPSEFRVTRSITISVPTAVAFTRVNHLRSWEAWSPWAKLDPKAKNSYEGPAAGTGAIMRWAGNSQVGAGSMTITESRPTKFIKFKIEFLKPFKTTNMSEFTFKPEGNQTMVTWTMFGKNNFLSKVMGLFVNCEKMVGEQFEKGLAKLKSTVEAAMSF